MQVASQWLLVVIVCLGLQLQQTADAQAADPAAEGLSSRAARIQATRNVPLQRLSPHARTQVSDVLQNPSFFRRMPTQQIACDPQMLTFLVRRPEVMVNIWEMMGITKVSAQRTTPYSFQANDGVGTACNCDLVYSNKNVHIYYGAGTYNGSMTPRKVKGRCVCVLYTQDRDAKNGNPLVAGTMDVFLKLDNFGADLLTRTLGPFVGKTADYNFSETAKFISQISQICTSSPATAQGLAMKLDKVDDTVRREFASLAAKIAVNTMAFPQSSQDPTVGSNLPSNDIFSVESKSQSDGESRNGLPKPVAMSHINDTQFGASNRVSPPELELSPSIPPTAIRPDKRNIYMRR